MKVVIAGGGTAGHVNPALALARALVSDEVTFVGTSTGAEAQLVPAAGFPLSTVEVSGFDRSRPGSIFSTAARAVRAIGEARRVLKGIDPDVVVGMGGYVSLPACLAARTLRRPIVLHEQNIVFGLANRVCRPLAQAVAVSFEDSLAGAGRKGVFTGNPVRPELTSFDRDAARTSGFTSFGLEAERKTLLVFGGSQGAQRINQAAIGLTSLWAERDDLQILHIAGRVQADSFIEQAEQTIGSHEAARLVYRVVGYVDDMAEAYSVADLALCRGGASTVAELGVVGLPSLIVPYPYHRDMQQLEHGRVLERAGAARVLADEETTAERVADEVDRLFADDTLKLMRERALEAGRPDAAESLAAVVHEAGGIR